jgi:hypothetical protein
MNHGKGDEKNFMESQRKSFLLGVLQPPALFTRLMQE